MPLSNIGNTQNIANDATVSPAAHRHGLQQQGIGACMLRWRPCIAFAWLHAAFIVLIVFLTSLYTLQLHTGGTKTFLLFVSLL